MIRIFRHYISGIYLILLLLEAGVFYAAFYVGYAIRFYHSTDLAFEEDLIIPSSIFMVVMLGSATGMGLYQRAQGLGDAGVLLRILGSFMLGTIVMSLVFYTFPGFFVGRGVFGYALLSALAGVTLFRFLFYKYADRQDLKRRILVIGAGSNARKIYDMERRTHNQNFHVIGYVCLNDEPCHIPADRNVHLNGPLNEFTNQQDIDEIVVAPDDRRRGFAVDEILDCKMTGYEVVDLLTFFEREAGIIKVDCLHPSWLVFSDGFRLSGLSPIVKRSFDVVASLMLLLLAWPIMLITALAILLESGRRAPIFYEQVRVGVNWRPFKVIKFRSMRTDAEKDGKARWAMKNDDRITRVGHFIRKARIDELPQLFNVLKGDMSFVGPRPERPEFVERFAETIPYYSERHRVKPGITGWAQLCYPYGATEQDAIEKLQFDLYYVKNYSLFLDLLIMMQTIEVVLWGKGAR